MRVAGAALLLLLLCACGATEEATLTRAARRVVQTRCGPVAGAVDAAGGARFVGVPYAAPPVGARRFAPPAPPPPWTLPLDCTQRRRVCPQLQSFMHSFVVGDEDCLHVNLFAPPAALDEALLPVMVFLHGGAFVAGDDSEAGLYDGAKLAANASVLVVTVNARLGVLGFLALPALGGAGNYGLQDQLAALRWVRDNVAAFGGDPARVTLFGQSAGAMSACAHVASPEAAGLFRAAILQSGNCDSLLVWSPLEVALRQGRAFATARGCPDDADAAACLRALPVAALLANDLHPDGAPLAPLLTWTPAVGGAGVPEVPLAALARNQGGSVPLIIGTVRDEGTMFAPLAPMMVGDAPLPLTETQLAQLLLRVYNASAVANMLQQRYTDGSPTARFAAILRDAFFVCPARRTAAVLARHGSAAWVYHFDYALRWPEARLWGWGTYHASELPFVFRNHGMHLFNAADRAVEATFSRLWGAFAHSADPGAGAPPAWPRYEPQTDESLFLDDEPRVRPGAFGSACAFWDATEVNVLSDGGAWVALAS
jgi:para-nitrobenzyl esterase